MQSQCLSAWNLNACYKILTPPTITNLWLLFKEASHIQITVQNIQQCVKTETKICRERNGTTETRWQAEMERSHSLRFIHLFPECEPELMSERSLHKWNEVWWGTGIWEEGDEGLLIKYAQDYYSITVWHRGEIIVIHCG